MIYELVECDVRGACAVSGGSVPPLPTLDQQLRLWHSAGNQCISLQGILPASAMVTVMSTDIRVSTSIRTASYFSVPPQSSW